MFFVITCFSKVGASRLLKFVLANDCMGFVWRV